MLVKKAKITLNGDVRRYKEVTALLAQSGRYGEIETGFRKCHHCIVLVDCPEDRVINEWWLETDNPDVPEFADLDVSAIREVTEVPYFRLFFEQFRELKNDAERARAIDAFNKHCDEHFNIRDNNGDVIDVLPRDLRGIDLSSLNLHGINLSDADLSGAWLEGACLTRADFSGANLSGAFLENANLADAVMIRANLVGADLRGANLAGADLRGANMTSANMTSARLWCTRMHGANLELCTVTGVKDNGVNYFPDGHVRLLVDLPGVGCAGSLHKVYTLVDGWSAVIVSDLEQIDERLQLIECDETLFAVINNALFEQV